MNSYGSRKFLAFLAVAVLSFVSLYFGKLDGSNVENIMLVLIPSYMAGNVAARFADERTRDK